jgi:hypothetical protein
MEKKINTDLVIKVANRANEIFGVDRLTIIMDITYCIEGGCDLDLKGLVESDEMNFRHDIVGIHNNLDRNTKKMNNCFLPRYSTNG